MLIWASFKILWFWFHFVLFLLIFTHETYFPCVFLSCYDLTCVECYDADSFMFTWVPFLKYLLLLLTQGHHQPRTTSKLKLSFRFLTRQNMDSDFRFMMRTNLLLWIFFSSPSTSKDKMSYFIFPWGLFLILWAVRSIAFRPVPHESVKSEVKAFQGFPEVLMFKAGFGVNFPLGVPAFTLILVSVHFFLLCQIKDS